MKKKENKTMRKCDNLKIALCFMLTAFSLLLTACGTKKKVKNTISETTKTEVIVSENKVSNLKLETKKIDESEDFELVISNAEHNEETYFEIEKNGKIIKGKTNGKIELKKRQQKVEIVKDRVIIEQTENQSQIKENHTKKEEVKTIDKKESFFNWKVILLVVVVIVVFIIYKTYKKFLNL